MVLIGHVLGGYNNHYLGGTNEWLAAANHVGTFGVELFFVLSGYVILNSIKKYNIADYLRHRFWRIYPVFLCFSLIYFVANRFLHIEPTADSVPYLLSNLVFLDLFLETPALTPNAWTITYEIWFYILSFAFLKPLLAFKPRWISIPAAGLCILFTVNYPLALYFAAGGIINVLEPHIRRAFHNLSITTISALEFLVVGGLIACLRDTKLRYSGSAILEDWRIPVVFVLTLLLFAILLSEKSVLARFFKRRTLLWLGTISYSLYLSHPYPYFVLKRLLSGLGHTEVGAFAALGFLFVVLVVSLPFAYLVHRLIEILPYRAITGKGIYAGPQIGLAASDDSGRELKIRSA